MEPQQYSSIIPTKSKLKGQSSELPRIGPDRSNIYREGEKVATTITSFQQNQN
jgi:hypothetical protein